MKPELLPDWSEQEQLKGERLRQVWEQFFSGAEQTAPGPREALSGQAEDQQLSAVQAQHEAALMRYPNVVGVADGVRMKRGKPTGERCLVVFVTRKLPKSKLRKTEVLPGEIDGIPIDVVEVGAIEPLPL